jgi:hypothetical protein
VAVGRIHRLLSLVDDKTRTSLLAGASISGVSRVRRDSLYYLMLRGCFMRTGLSTPCIVTIESSSDADLRTWPFRQPTVRSLHVSPFHTFQKDSCCRSFKAGSSVHSYCTEH